MPAAPVELLGDSSSALYWPRAFSAGDSDRLLDALERETEWRHEEITVAGRRVLQPRLTAWQGDPGAEYRYSGLALQPRPWGRAACEIRAVAEALAQTTFDSVLLNLYRDGHDSMGWHADDEKVLGVEPVIASVSFGGLRRFVLRRRDDPAVRVEVEPAHGSAIVMAGRTQHEWMHAVPKTARAVEPRINLTFRRIRG
ncbi:MAG TPA: alpha-ketoglutarate-dependent dioxygenase AlkB [Acidimicrobiales bacterium]|nr:alpha-ketoglutarate-dependent dioxygenase AlkB [Acidimicrobiales bacterium]